MSLIRMIVEFDFNIDLKSDERRITNKDFIHNFIPFESNNFPASIIDNIIDISKEISYMI